MDTRRSAPPRDALVNRLHHYARAHADLPWPEGARPT
jgi:hypothetical protein